MTEAHKQ